MKGVQSRTEKSQRCLLFPGGLKIRAGEAEKDEGKARRPSLVTHKSNTHSGNDEVVLQPVLFCKWLLNVKIY